MYSKFKKLITSWPYLYSADWTNGHISNWQKTLEKFVNSEDVRYLEIGVFQGRTLLWMLRNIFSKSKHKAVVIDKFESHPRWPLLWNLRVAKMSSRVEVRIGSSRDHLQRLLEEELRFNVIYVDGSHQESDVELDADASWRLLMPGGVLLFDDYLWKLDLPFEQRPQRAIERFLKKYEGQFELLYQGYQIIIMKKESSPVNLS